MLLVLSACRYDTSSTLVRSSTAAAGTRVGDLVGDFMAAPPPALFLANAAADRAAGLLLSDMLHVKLSDQGEVLPSILVAMGPGLLLFSLLPHPQQSCQAGAAAPRPQAGCHRKHFCVVKMLVSYAGLGSFYGAGWASRL